MGREDALTLEKLKIHERLAVAEGQLGAVKTLLEDLHKQQCNKQVTVQSAPKEEHGGVGKTLGVAALLTTVLIAVIGPIHQKIDFVQKTGERRESALAEHQREHGHAGSLAEIATLKQRFAEVETQFKNLDERTVRMEVQFGKDIESAVRVFDAKMSGEIKAAESIHEVMRRDTVHLKEQIAEYREKMDELKRTVYRLEGKLSNGGGEHKGGL